MKTMLIAALALVSTPALAADAVDGAQTFADNCSACHQAQGEGIPGAFPALAKNKFVTGTPQLVVKTLLDGRGGMPSFRDSLTDEQIAAVLSFVRKSWGNAAAPITSANVAAVRAGQAMKTERPMPIH